MADILKPELIWIEGRCYRVNDPTTEVTALQEHDLYESEVNYDDKMEAMDLEDDIEIVTLNDSRYATYFHVPKPYIGSIIGKKGIMKMRIEKETKTTIKIPRQGESGDVSILGPTPANVRSAKRRIDLIVMSARMKQKPTHFISIPMNNEEIKSKFNKFKEKVIDEIHSEGVDESLFIAAEKLHLTIAVMCLMDNEERIQASKLLQDSKEKIIMPIIKDHLPLMVRVKGLAYMNDDPKQITVLYGQVSEERSESKGVVQKLANALFDCFSEAGFVKEENRNSVKLHVTIMNSSYRSESNEDNKYIPFDATEILKRFGDYDFGLMNVTEIHLSQRHAVGPDGYYQPTCIVTVD